MQIRKLTEGDVPTASVIYCGCFAEPPWYEAFDPASVAKEMYETMSWSDAVMAAAACDGRLVAAAYGFALRRKPDIIAATGAPPDAFYLAEIFVDPAARLRGLSTRLVEAVLAAARKDAGIGVVRTSVDQPIILHIFRKLGWETAAEQEVVSEKTVDGETVSAPDRRVIMVGRI